MHSRHSLDQRTHVCRLTQRMSAEPTTGPLSHSLPFRLQGGPVAQINSFREHLVKKEKWITDARFNRVYAVYQILPGPEATELACYFGLISGGRLNGLLSGLGFITPGFLLMLGFAWYYEYHGLTNRVFQAIFLALQPAVCAMVFRAAHKISESTFKDADTKSASSFLMLIGAVSGLSSVLQVNYFIIKLHAGLMFMAYKHMMDVQVAAGGKRNNFWYGVTAAVTLLPLAAYITSIAVLGPMEKLMPMGVGVGQRLGNTYAGHFVVGLLGGLVTFGGAYTAIPFMRYETVDAGGWLQNQVFLDALAVCALLPTPLVMFSTMIGYAAATKAGLDKGAGAVLMTLGMFLPAFAFPLISHDFFEKLASKRGPVAHFLDGMSASVVGMVAVTGCQLLRTAVRANQPLDAIIFLASLNALYSIKSPWTPVIVILAVGQAGFLFFY